jgi:arylsulfatase A-like enzyme
VLGDNGANGGYGALDHTNTLPVWETSNGYYTCHIGKYMNIEAIDAEPPGWSEWYTADHSLYFDYDLNENGVVVHYGHDPRDYVTDVETEKAVSFINDRRYGNRPFFLVVDYTAPHGTQPPVVPTGTAPIPAPWYQGMFDHYVPRWPPNFDERNVSDKPPTIQRLPLFTRSVIGSLTANVRTVAETLLSVDDGVGRIVGALEAAGELDDTVIMFTSDNGMERGDHRIVNGKNHMYEESIRVPLFVRGPGIQRGVSVQSVVANIDYAPTIVDLTGATAGLEMDGTSLVALLTGSAAFRREGILLESYVGADQQPVGLRTDDFAYGEYPDGFVELYVLSSDPYELQNQAYNPLYANTIGPLHVRLQALRHVQPGGR